jgi:hypothetical protein
MAALSGIRHPPPKARAATGVLGDLNASEIQRIDAQLRRDGYYVFARQLPLWMQSALGEFALTAPTRPLASNASETLNEFTFAYLSDRPYDRSNVVSAKYVLDSQSAAEQPAVQHLLLDPTIHSVASAYLRTDAINDDITMWWSTDHLGGKASSAAAQHYHFDMDRIKFLKFFFYLTDVTTENGPHCYVTGSHARKPRQLLRDGRISDSEIRQYYSDEQLVEITGVRGTIIAADTRGFHKGKPLISGERLILEFEFATSLFGAECSRIKVTERFTKEFREAVGQHRRLFANFER